MVSKSRRAAINAARALQRRARGPVGIAGQWEPQQAGTTTLVVGFGRLGTGTLGDPGGVVLGSTALDYGDLLGEYPAAATFRLSYDWLGRGGHLA